MLKQIPLESLVELKSAVEEEALNTAAFSVDKLNGDLQLVIGGSVAVQVPLLLELISAAIEYKKIISHN